MVGQKSRARFIAESVSEKNIIVGEFWQSCKQERDCLVHFLSLLAVCWPGVQSAWDNHTLACDFSQIFTYLKNHTQQ